MSRLIQRWERNDDRSIKPMQMRCDCGCTLEGWRAGGDVDCDKCGREYNSSGQLLADRSQWGCETGEHPADIARAFRGGDGFSESDCGGAFDGNTVTSDCDGGL